jgi:hypothetical protein
MINTIVVVGDLHLQPKTNIPKHGQVLEFLSWLFNDSTLNTEDSVLLLLGDLVETMDDPAELLEIYIDYFLNKSKFSKIGIMKGNHDENMNSSFTSALRPLHNVQIIETITELTITGINCLFLPYYDHTKIGNSYPPMNEYYSSKEIIEKFGATTYDYTYHHVEDELTHYSKKFCDLSWIKSNNWLCGHIHTETITQGGRILGAPIFNSSSESDKIPYIAKIDTNTKKYELIKVPIYLSYHTINYPENIVKPDTKYSLWTVNNSLDKNETIKYYTKQATELGFTFYPLRINSRRVTKELIKETSTNTKESYTKIFDRYTKANKVSTAIIDICKPILVSKENEV